MVRAGCFTGNQGRWSENVLVEEGARWIVHGNAGTGGQRAHIVEKGRKWNTLKGSQHHLNV